MTGRAVVIANAAIDETYAVASLPRPGESVIGAFVARDLGGKGANVATVLARAGVRTTLVASVGEDERGAFVRERLAVEPLEAALSTASGLPTDLSIVQSTPDGDNAIVTTVAASHALEPAHAVVALDALAPGDLVVLQGNLAATLTLALIERARERDLVVVLNPSPLAPWLHEAIAGAHVVFANEAEAEALSGARGDDAVRVLLASGPDRVCVTRGGRGAVLGARDDVAERRETVRIVPVPAAAADVVDTTGAGDTFMAVALASAARRGTALDERALAHATRAAAITVGRRGTASAFPSVGELAALW